MTQDIQVAVVRVDLILCAVGKLLLKAVIPAALIAILLAFILRKRKW